MDNKLSELSKPTACRNKFTGRTFNATKNTEPQIYESLYSQEYVSALLERIEELEGKEKARTKLIEDTWNNIPMWQPPKHTGRGA